MDCMVQFNINIPWVLILYLNKMDIFKSIEKDIHPEGTVKNRWLSLKSDIIFKQKEPLRFRKEQMWP